MPRIRQEKDHWIVEVEDPSGRPQQFVCATQETAQILLRAFERAGQPRAREH